jgi:uncharacterized protein YjcR
MAEKKRKTLKPKVLKDGTQVYGSPEEWSKSMASGPVDSKFWGKRAGWDAAMEGEFGDEYYASQRKKNVKRAKDSQAREKARGMMGGGMVRGYESGGEVCRGGGKAMSGTKFRGVR